MITHQAILDCALEAAREAGQLTLTYFRTSTLTIDFKGDRSEVTVADREAEALIRQKIGTRFPQHKILGEEEGGDGDLRDGWVIDPIDGTRSFVNGIPLYGVLIAYMEDGEPVVGVCYNPFLDEMAYGIRGQGAWLNGQQLGISPLPDDQKRLYLMTDPGTLYRMEPKISQVLLNSGASIRTWADCYGYLLLAKGQAQIMIDPILNPWDIAAVKIIITEAGYAIRSLKGDEGGLLTSSIAYHPELHSLVQDLLSQ